MDVQFLFFDGFIFFANMISMIAAIGENNELGADNDLVWTIRDDMKIFRMVTSGHTVLMGRKSFEAMNGPLPNRTNVVITKNTSYEAPGAVVRQNLDTAIDEFENDSELFILGGGEIYAAVLPRADRLYLSHVKGTFPQADTFFPQIAWENWREITRESYPANDRNEFAFDYVVYERKSDK